MIRIRDVILLHPPGNDENQGGHLFSFPALMQTADDLFENSVVSDATWAVLSKSYSTEQLMDAVFTVGQYNLVSWALNSFGVPLDDFLPGAAKG